MSDNVVQFVTKRYHHETKHIVQDHAYQFRDDRPCRWLQKACLWVLKKLGAHYIHKQAVVTETKHVLDIDSAFKAIRIQKEKLFRDYHLYGTRVLIGSDDFAELMASDEINAYAIFTKKMELWGGNLCTIFGMTVEVVPWMKGVIVMPDNDEALHIGSYKFEPTKGRRNV